MRPKTTKLNRAITLALFASANAALGVGAAFAQSQVDAAQADAAATEKGEASQNLAPLLDTIQVTGSRIQNQAITASSPVMEIQADAFQFSGATRVDDLVNQYPQLAPVFDSFENNGATGFPTVSLRNLGPQRTLTLVNGARMAQGAAFATDISIVPASLVKRVDILTGGASAVYGSDAVAGVVNFLLDTEFEGVSVNIGAAAFRHNNNNKLMQSLQEARGFDFPDGDSGFDGESGNIDVALGSSFADGRGHAMVWATWRDNEALFQGERDFSSCALNAAGTACGGSNTNAAGNFYFYQPGVFGSPASLNPDGTFRSTYGAPFNYAPINFFQRPDERYTFGSSLKFEVNEHFKPYLETMFINRRSAIQVAESGAFFTALDSDCADPLIRTACADLGIDPADGPLVVYIAKRNVEGGPRRSSQEDTNFRIITGAEGAITDSWSYNASFLYSQNNSDIVGQNDFLTPRILEATRGCPAGSFSGCLPWQVFVPGGVTEEAARAIAGTSLSTTSTELTEISAYVTGDLGIGLPSAKGDTVSLVLGANWREDTYNFTADSDSQAGNFAGAGGPSLPLSGVVRVNELFMESLVPLVSEVGIFDSVNLDLGYRWSDYNLAGTANTWKIGFGADLDMVKVRGGFNRAIRAPNVFNLFATEQLALFGGEDPCAGPNPTFTQAQCANTGVTADRFGFIPNNAAAQFNQLIGGTLDLVPEEADTWTAGIVITPIKDLYVNVDYYRIKISDTIAQIGAQTILNGCATTGDPGLCSLVQRSAAGDLFRGNDPVTSGRVVNLTSNFGERLSSGIDFGAGYFVDDVLGGRIDFTFQGTYVLDDRFSPLAGVNDDFAFECAGKINISCQTHEWRHISSVRYSQDLFSVGLRWRFFGSLDYKGNEGENLSTDKRLCSPDGGTTAAFASCQGNGGIGSFTYLDLSGSVKIGQYGELTLGVNNIADKEPPLVGATVALNANAPGGYDQVGRYFFSSFTLRF
ncbi:MAG: TonB-dependent receptor [Xanthomonadaceae bacterium]|nr:TonB-dependent receptor [Xanthomonadaceae bacterium]